eukprot:PhF_6_TR18927/c0_g1_i1/m.27696
MLSKPVSLRELYTEECKARSCKVNSGVAALLPNSPNESYTLHELDLSKNFVGKNGLKSILQVAKASSCLEILNLRDNYLDNDSVSEVCAALDGHQSLTSLDLGRNQISHTGGKELNVFVTRNSRIFHVGLDQTYINKALIKMISRKVEENQSRAASPLSSTASIPYSVGGSVSRRQSDITGKQDPKPGTIGQRPGGPEQRTPSPVASEVVNSSYAPSPCLVNNPPLQTKWEGYGLLQQVELLAKPIPFSTRPPPVKNTNPTPIGPEWTVKHTALSVIFPSSAEPESTNVPKESSAKVEMAFSASIPMWAEDSEILAFLSTQARHQQMSAHLPPPSHTMGVSTLGELCPILSTFEKNVVGEGQTTIPSWAENSPVLTAVAESAQPNSQRPTIPPPVESTNTLAKEMCPVLNQIAETPSEQKPAQHSNDSADNFFVLNYVFQLSKETTDSLTGLRAVWEACSDVPGAIPFVPTPRVVADQPISMVSDSDRPMSPSPGDARYGLAQLLSVGMKMGTSIPALQIVGEILSANASPRGDSARKSADLTPAYCDSPVKAANPTPTADVSQAPAGDLTSLTTVLGMVGEHKSLYPHLFSLSEFLVTTASVSPTRKSNDMNPTMCSSLDAVLATLPPESSEDPTTTFSALRTLQSALRKSQDSVTTGSSSATPLKTSGGGQNALPTKEGPPMDNLKYLLKGIDTPEHRCPSLFQAIHAYDQSEA